MVFSHQSKATATASAQAGGSTVLYNCDSCNANISNTVRIRCAECEDFDLCVRCFCSGKEVAKHKSYHRYRVIERLQFSIFEEDWGADEEVLLIEGAELYGLGNWADIADHVGSKTTQECEKHYLDTYVASETWPLPNMNVPLDTSPEAVAARKQRQQERLKASLAKPLVPPGKPLQSLPSNHEIAGYMPCRMDFETEYDNEAEQYVKDMAFTPEDTPEDIELKLAVLEIYNSKLDRRAERRKFIHERNLLDYRKNQAIERKRPREERELCNRTKVFARMQTKEDYEMFVEGLLNEMRLKKRIRELQDYRANGITTLVAGAQYEKEKAQRVRKLLQLLSCVVHSFSGSHSVTSTLFQQQAALQQARSRENSVSSERLIIRYGPRASPVRDEVNSPTRAPAPKEVVRKQVASLDLHDADGVSLLTPPERDMCSALRILPRAYLVIKETILKEYALVGSIRKRRARELIKIDVNKTGRVYDFFVEMGWIKTGSSTSPTNSAGGSNE